MKIENGMISGTIDELIDYAFEHNGDEILKAWGEEFDKLAEQGMKNSNWNDDDGHLWKRICESLEKMEKEEEDN